MSSTSYVGGNSGDAWDFLQSILTTLNLTSADAQNIINNAYTQNWSSTQVTQALRTTQEWQTEYAPIVERQQLGLPPISEADVLNLRSQYAQIDSSNGAPAGFNSNEHYDQFIVNDMSPQEYQDRWTTAHGAVNADPAVQAELFKRGITPGDVAAYYFDPEKTVNALQRQFTSAQIGAAASRTGYGNLGITQADQLTAQGISQDQAMQGFNQLAQQDQLFSSLPGQAEKQITQDQQLAATFGNDAQNQQLIQQRAKQRAATTKQGGSYSSTQTGTGIGSAR